MPVYDGTQNTWVREYIDLSDWLGKKIQLRFRLVTDNYTNRDGFYIDDISVIRQGITSSAGINGSVESTLSIQPNPARNYIELRWKDIQESSPVLYEIKDITGRIMYSAYAVNENTILDISSYAPGVYIINVIAGEKKLIQKFVVN